MKENPLNKYVRPSSGVMSRDLIPVVHEKVDSVNCTISLQWITKLVSLELMHWIVIFPVDTTIQRLNKRSLEDNTLLVEIQNTKADKNY